MIGRKNVIGRSVPRIEDGPLLRGRARFAADINFPHQLHMRVVRSPVAHARIKGIGVSGALGVPGVYAVWTAEDIAGLGPIEFREGKIDQLEAYRQPLLATDIVRYVGEPMAVVFAEDDYLAEDAADLVTLDLDPLPVILSAEALPGPFAPGLSSEAAVVRQGYGDVDLAFRSAHAVIELRLEMGRHSGVPLETRGAVGRYDASRDVLELHGAAKVPHKNREMLAQMLGRSTAGVHLFEAHVGGGFGVRGEIYPEDVLVLAAALRFGRPIKWIEDRLEHLIATNHSRQQIHYVRAAVDAAGRLLAIDNEFFHDQGAYPRTHGKRIAETTCGILPGPYKVDAYRALGHYRLTNKTPAATYRAPGRYEANFVRERLLDAIAERLAISRVDVRLRNLIPPEEMPYERPLSVLGDDLSYDTGDYRGMFEKSLVRFGWDDVQATLAARRRSGELVGAGIGIFIEKSGLGPVDGAKVNVDVTGHVEVITGGASVGQGFETVMAQVCAETLGVDYRKVRVVHGRTERIEFGLGAHASRATVMTANAVAVAANHVRAKALDMASELLQTAVDRLDIVDGIVHIAGDATGASISLGDVARSMRPGSSVLGERVPGLAAEGWFRADHQVYPYGAHLALVRIDPETGGVAVEKYLVACDVGRAINPMLVAGQIVGGCAQGLGGALFEEFRYSPEGDPLSITFADYLVPTLHDVPTIEVLVLEDAPTFRNPLGIKGAGEAGIAAVAAAIASAVDDALQMPGAVTHMPITPQTIVRLLAERTTDGPCA